MTTLMAQNQFRDYVNFRQGQFEQNRAKIERKDGKVIIVMTEEQFKQMQRRKEFVRRRMVGPHGMGPRFIPQPPKCEKCRRHMKKHH